MMSGHRFIAALVALLITAPAFAQEPVGCDKFKWPLERERALLATAAPAASGAEISQPLTAVKITLAPYADAHLPAAPERAPKSADSYAGFVRMSAPPKAGLYRITLSQGAWIDVIQDGHEVKSAVFSGATGCAGVRKSVKFELAAAPFVIILSGTTVHDIAVVVTAD
jgi:hypothetical protein